MGATKKEVAEKLGVAKQTVVNYIAKLDLASHVTRVGKTDVLDDFAVSAIADALGKNVLPSSTLKEDRTSTSDAVVDALMARIEDLKEQNDSKSEMIRNLARENESLRSQLRDANDQLREANDRASGFADRFAEIAERQQAIAAAPWWRRGRIAMKLLGPGSE